jgi:hypothetical protein
MGIGKETMKSFHDTLKEQKMQIYGDEGNRERRIYRRSAWREEMQWRGREIYEPASSYDETQHLKEGYLGSSCFVYPGKSGEHTVSVPNTQKYDSREIEKISAS